MHRETITGIMFFLHYFKGDSDEKGTDGCHFVFIDVAGGDKFWFTLSDSDSKQSSVNPTNLLGARIHPEIHEYSFTDFLHQLRIRPRHEIANS